MLKRILAVSLLAILSTAVTARAADIVTIEAQPTGTLVTLDSNPVVTVLGSVPGSVDGFTFTNYAIFAQDSTGSLELFGHLPGSYVPAVGDTVGVNGTFSPFHSIPEIGTMTSLANTGTAAVPAPLLITPAQLQGTPTNAIFGYYAEMDNVLITQQNVSNPVPGNFPVHANGTYTITDSLGNNPVEMFQWASSYSLAGAMGGTPVPTGLVNMTGFVSQTAGFPAEFTPFFITAAPEPATIVLLALGGLVMLRKRSMA